MTIVQLYKKDWHFPSTILMWAMPTQIQTIGQDKTFEWAMTMTPWCYPRHVLLELKATRTGLLTLGCGVWGAVLHSAREKQQQNLEGVCTRVARSSSVTWGWGSRISSRRSEGTSQDFWKNWECCPQPAVTWPWHQQLSGLGPLFWFLGKTLFHLDIPYCDGKVVGN